jgi:uncharacterized membrane protein
VPTRADGGDLSVERRRAAPPARDAVDADAPCPVTSPLVRLVRGLFVFLGALPWWIPVARSRLPLGELGTALDRFFLPMCHRLPERSLVLEGVPMPLCSRCAGIFAGMALGALIARPGLSMAVWRPALIAVSALMMFDVATQDLGLHPLWHASLLATGFALGYAMLASFVTHLARRPG